jgi:hypothetical protein
MMLLHEITDCHLSCCGMSLCLVHRSKSPAFWLSIRSKSTSNVATTSSRLSCPAHYITNPIFSDFLEIRV